MTIERRECADQGRHVASAVREEIADDVVGDREAAPLRIGTESRDLVLVREGHEFMHETPTQAAPQVLAQSERRGGRARGREQTAAFCLELVEQGEQARLGIGAGGIHAVDRNERMWQYYFSPPTGHDVSFSVATTRRVARYTITREDDERIEWGQGEIDTVRWHRVSEDGRSDGYVWLAPSLRFIPVKIRYTGPRGTFEALLQSIRADETAEPAS